MQTFGGSLYTCKDRKNRRRIYQWVITGKACTAFLVKIYKYLKVKQQQAVLAFAWAATKRISGKRVTPEELETRKAFKARMSKLNWASMESEE